MKGMDKKKVKCNERRCGWRGTSDQQLSAPNPFEEGETIWACPKCKSIDSIVYACDEPGCWGAVSCGMLTSGGYRNTCFDHRPDR